MARDGNARGCEQALNASPGLANVPDSCGTPPLLLAAGNNRGSVVALLLKHGANPNATETALNTTPLHWASYKGHITIIEMLLQAGADVNARDKVGRSPLDMAADGGQTAVIKFLTEHGGRSTDPIARELQ